MSTAQFQQGSANALHTYNERYFGGIENAFLGHPDFINSTFTQSISGIGSNINKLFAHTFDTADWNTNTSLPDVFVKPKDTNSNNPSKPWDYYVKMDHTKWTDIEWYAATYVEDIIVTSWLGTDSATAPAKALMDSLYMYYDLLDESKWKDFKKGTTVTLSTGHIRTPATLTNNTTASMFNPSDRASNLKAALGTRHSSWVPVTQNVRLGSTDTAHTTTMGMLTSIVDPVVIMNTPGFNVFAFRRLLYLYIRMLGMRICMDAYESITDKTIRDSVRSILNAMFNMLHQDIATMQLSGGVVTSISEGITRRMQTYTNNTDLINDITNDIDDGRITLNQNLSRLTSEQKFEKRAKALSLIAMVVLMLVLGAVGVVVVTPLEKIKKLQVVAVALAASAIGALVLNVTFSKTVTEGFTTPGENGSGEYRAATYVSDILEIANHFLVYNQTMMDGINTYRAYGNLNNAMNKEYSFYQGANTRIKNAGAKVKSVYRVSDLEQKQFVTRMQFFLVLSIILSGTALVYVATEDHPSAKPFIFGIGGTLAVFAFVIFLLESTSYVRTDGDKKYWAQPTTTM
jgi:hypothetical protein